MDGKLLLALVTGFVAFFAGVATDWLRQWSANWFVVRDIRRAIRAEMAPVIVSLNFFILMAIEDQPDGSPMVPSFGEDSPLTAFEYYWTEKRDLLLKLPEWSRLRNWEQRLLGIRRWPEPPLFSAIMLFEALSIAPLDKAVDGTSTQTIKNTLARADVEEYKMAYFRQRAGILPPR